VTTKMARVIWPRYLVSYTVPSCLCSARKLFYTWIPYDARSMGSSSRPTIIPMHSAEEEPEKIGLCCACLCITSSRRMHRLSMSSRAAARDGYIFNVFDLPRPSRFPILMLWKSEADSLKLQVLNFDLERLCLHQIPTPRRA